MRRPAAITDVFIRRPVIALVVNLVILIAGLQAIRSISVRQYPRSENADIRPDVPGGRVRQMGGRTLANRLREGGDSDGEESKEKGREEALSASTPNFQFPTSTALGVGSWELGVTP